jgi:hypothetical protein
VRQAQRHDRVPPVCLAQKRVDVRHPLAVLQRREPLWPIHSVRVEHGVDLGLCARLHVREERHREDECR